MHKLILLTIVSLGMVPLISGANVSHRVAMDFLEIDNSPISVGMGHCGLNLVDAESALRNPGAFGVFYLDHLGALAIPNSNEWLPEYSDQGMTIASHSVSGRVYSIGARDDPDSHLYSIGIAYSRHTFDWGTVGAYDMNGRLLFTSNPLESADIVTVGIGADNGYRIGIGYSLKYLESEDWGRTTFATAHDLGLMAEYPFSTLPRSRRDPDKLAIQVTPSLAVVGSNLGAPAGISGFSSFLPLPSMWRVGLSLLADLRSEGASFLSIRGVYEKGYDLTEEEWRGKHRGLEIGLLGAFYYRAGKSHLKHRWVRDVETTVGFGFRLRGLMNLLIKHGRIKKGSSMSGYLNEHLDISFDYASVDDVGVYPAVGGTKFIRFALSF